VESRIIKLLDGKEYELRYPNKAIYSLENRLGLSNSLSYLFRDDASISATLSSPRFLMDAIWAGLLHRYPGMAHSKVVDLFDSSRLSEYAEAVGMLIADYYGYSADEAPEVEEDPKNV
jgi:hypothetical protein